MKKFLFSAAILASTLGFVSPAFAVPTVDGDFGIEVGVRQQSGDVDGTGSTTSQTGFQAGVTGSFAISTPLFFRTGLLYTQRPLKIDGVGGGSDTKVSMNYLDIPLTLEYKFQDYAGVFLGVIASMNLDHSVDNGGTLTGVKSFIMPITLGVTFKFAPQLGATLYYETQSGDVSDQTKNYRAVGANLLITFE